MEFWIGLSVGMHLGKLIAQYLEKLGNAYGLLDKKTDEKANKLEDEEEGDLEKVTKGLAAAVQDEAEHEPSLTQELQKVAEEISEIAEEVGD